MELEQRIEEFIAHWRETGGSELANTQSFINGLCGLLGVQPPNGSKIDDQANDYVFERRVFQDNGDGTKSFGRIDAYKRDCFILEAKQGSEGDQAAFKNGEDDLDLFGQTASARVKRGTAKRGTPSWAKAMIQAKGQAERYAKALPLEHGWPPILLVTDIGYCIEVFADFSGTGKAYAQFPDRARYRVMLEDLRDPDVRRRLKAIWEDPRSLDPATNAAKVTRKIADLLATVAKRIETRKHSAEQTSGFLMRILFTFFAEDCSLIPKDSFTKLLLEQRAKPDILKHQLEALWATMDTGGFSPALGVQLKKFNGYLFKTRTAILLEDDEIKVLIDAGGYDWTEVEPAIFGTLLERALNPKERAKLGAHYTPRAYVERLIGPTIMEPLRADWDGVRVAAASLIEEGKADEARAHVEAFHAKFAQTRVLDPACGTGNFLYVAMARMKELEGEVVDLLIELGDDQYVAELTGHTIMPENFLGIEINPRAAEIAQLVLWIGYLQWHFRVFGAGRIPEEPILSEVRTIENRDALIAYDSRVLERDENGKPITRWDGETEKIHPITAKMVPDDDAQVEVYRYVKPSAAKWPKADFIVGNPPFIGGKDVRRRLGDGYFDALFATTDVPESADFVMHWWDKAAVAVRKSGTRRFGFVTTNSITQVFSRRVIAKHMTCKDRLSVLFAIADHPWVDERDGAAVRIAMTVAGKGKAEGQLLSVSDESGAPETIEFKSESDAISCDLRVGVDLTSTIALKANEDLCSPGVKLHGDGFIVSGEAAKNLLPDAPDAAAIRTGDQTEAVIFEYRNGRDLAARSRGVKVIDLYGLNERQVRDRYPAIYQHLSNAVRPQREGQAAKSPTADAKQYAEKWWLFGKPRPELRKALHGIRRYIATIETAKHRVFQFLPKSVLPDNMLVCIALSDAFHLGVLSSRMGVVWALEKGGTLEDRPRYNKTQCFDPFPFPADVPEALKHQIRAEGESLDALRKRVLEDHDDLTLTKLYNVLEALREGRTLSDQERDIHDRGLVSLILQHHQAIDALVGQAYGWPADLSDEEILTRFVALNKERAAAEANGLVHWLRPEYQAPNYVPPAQGLDLGDAPATLPDNIISWPGTLPEQVSAVQLVLSNAAIPLAAQDVARAFKNKRASTVKPVLDALAGIGMARRLNDGRYAA